MTDCPLFVGAGIGKIAFTAKDFPIKQFTGVHDDLHVRVVLINTNESFAFVSLELTSLPANAITFYKNIVMEMTGIEESHIWISVTHTFSAPHIPASERTSEEVEIIFKMYNKTSTALKEALQQAIEKKTAAEFAFELSKCGININRNMKTADGWWFGNNEMEYSNHDVRVVTFRDHSQHPIAVLYNFDIQPSVMDNVITSAGEKLVSADIAGAASQYVEKKYGPETVAIFLPGAAGDQAPILKGISWDIDGNGKPKSTSRGTDSFILVEALGNYLGKSVITAIRNSNHFTETCRLQLKQINVSVPEQKMLYSTKELKPSKNYPFVTTGGKLRIPVDILTINSLSMLGTPPELNSSFGQIIRHQFNEPNTFICTLINGRMKYLPQQIDYERITYTAMNTMIGQGADKILLREIRKLIQSDSE